MLLQAFPSKILLKRRARVTSPLKAGRDCQQAIVVAEGGSTTLGRLGCFLTRANYEQNTRTAYAARLSGDALVSWKTRSRCLKGLPVPSTLTNALDRYHLPGRYGSTYYAFPSSLVCRRSGDCAAGNNLACNAGSIPERCRHRLSLLPSCRIVFTHRQRHDSRRATTGQVTHRDSFHLRQRGILVTRWPIPLSAARICFISREKSIPSNTVCWGPATGVQQKSRILSQSTENGSVYPTEELVLWIVRSPSLRTLDQR